MNAGGVSFVFCFPASILCVAAVGLNQWSPWDGDGNGKAKSLFMDIRLSLTFASVGSICIYTGQTKYLSQTAKKKKWRTNPAPWDGSRSQGILWPLLFVSISL